MVSQAVKTVFRLRPPLPQYQSMFDIVPVLAYIQSLPTANLSLQLLSFKALFLTIYSSISRVSSMARLTPSFQETRDSAILHLQSLEKQARAGKVRGYFQIPRFSEDPELCPVCALSIYFSKVKVLILELFHITHFSTCRCQESVETQLRFLCLMSSLIGVLPLKLSQGR